MASRMMCHVVLCCKHAWHGICCGDILETYCSCVLYHFAPCVCALAEAAAYSAAQEASAHCSSAAIPGTSSSLLAPIAALTRAVQQQLQRQQEQQHGGERQHQQQERWSAQLLGSRSSSWRSSSSSGECGQLERAVLAGFKGLQLERRLASFRLHR